MNFSDNNRIDNFCRELALALRRITGVCQDTLPDDLPQMLADPGIKSPNPPLLDPSSNSGSEENDEHAGR
jgi:hypothetical protein